MEWFLFPSEAGFNEKLFCSEGFLREVLVAVNSASFSRAESPRPLVGAAAARVRPVSVSGL